METYPSHNEDTANNNQITILSAVILNITGQSHGGTQHTTKQCLCH